jgi:hypothetical protein
MAGQHSPKDWSRRNPKLIREYARMVKAGQALLNHAKISLSGLMTMV